MWSHVSVVVSGVPHTCKPMLPYPWESAIVSGAFGVPSVLCTLNSEHVTMKSLRMEYALHFYSKSCGMMTVIVHIISC